MVTARPVAVALAYLAVLAAPACSAEELDAKEELKVHPCAGAGRWFPADAAKLREICEVVLSCDAAPVPEPPVALISPHAGYQFSAAVAGRGYKTVQGRAYERVILMGPSHRTALAGGSVLRVDAYETPLGRVPVDAEARDALLACPVVKETPAAHENEHSVENQLPILQHALGDFRMVELLVGRMTDAQRTELAKAVRALVDEKTLLVVSTDFCHYGPNYGYVPFEQKIPQNLVALNNRACQELFEIDVAGWDAFLAQTRDTVCGRDAVGLLLKVLEPMEDVRGLRVGLDLSGRMTGGDYTNSVTYAALTFWRAGKGLSEADRKTLLDLASRCVEEYLRTGEAPKLDLENPALTPALRAPGAVFVTLKNADRLRGCIGQVVAHKPLFVAVVENACNACRDPRFRDTPVTLEEVPHLSIDISVLTPMRRLTDPTKVRVGTDGLMMARGEKRGLLLPQVPVEQGWDRETFLSSTCRKAGLPLDAWKDKDTEIYRFRARVFGRAPDAGAAEAKE